MLHHWIEVWFRWVEQGGYAGVIALMAMESSIFPVPSEVVIPPAAFLASHAGSSMSVWGVIVAGTFGSWLGAAITYWVSRGVGRVVIVAWGKYLLISEAKLQRAEHWVHRYEAGGIFFARLLPVIRHLISIPAGIIHMNFKVFSMMTILGSAIWCSVLARFGTTVITDKLMKDPASIMKDPALKHQLHLILLAVLVLCVLYFVVMRLTEKRAEPN